jgi:DNA-binding LacI/PurR family transcriptional regulator/DNA-binding transcriptional regulator YhcF (GntR family)
MAKSDNGNTPSVAKAMSYVGAIAPDDPMLIDGRLPGLRRLARICGVSYLTMWRAMQRLVADKKMAVGAGRRFVLPGSPAPRPPAAPQPRARRIIESILRDIVAGKLAANSPIAGLKELTARYGAGRGTMGRVVRDLCDQGVLMRTGRAIEVARMAGPRPSARIVVLCFGDLIRFDKHNAEIFGALERESALLNLKCDINTCAIERDALVAKNLWSVSNTGIPAGGDVLGYVIVTHPLAEPTVRLIAAVQRYGKPVALLDDSGVVDSMRLRQPRVEMRVFRIGVGEIHGRRAGRYLLEMGHRRIGYLMQESDGPWALQRLAGLRGECAVAGNGAEVVHKICRPWPSMRDPLSGRSATMTLNQFVRLFERQMNIAPIRTPMYFEHDLAPFFGEVIGGRRLQISLDADLNALVNRRVTVIVCSHGHLALYAAQWLRGRRDLDLPRDMSLFTFDSGFAITTNGISSYDLDMPAAVRGMLHFCIDPHRIPQRGTLTTDIAGRIIDRGSVASL